MKLRDLILVLSDPDHVDIEQAMEMDVEFCTLDSGGLSLLSIYEADGKICIDIGTNEDADLRNNELLKA